MREKEYNELTENQRERVYNLMLDQNAMNRIRDIPLWDNAEDFYQTISELFIIEEDD